MGCTLGGHALRRELRHISVDLCIALRCSSLHIFRLLASIPLVLGSLPLGQPSFGIGSGARVLRIDMLRQNSFALSSLRDENFCTRSCLLHLYGLLLGLLLLATVRQTFIEQRLD